MQRSPELPQLSQYVVRPVPGWVHLPFKFLVIGWETPGLPENGLNEENMASFSQS